MMRGVYVCVYVYIGVAMGVFFYNRFYIGQVKMGELSLIKIASLMRKRSFVIFFLLAEQRI